MPTPTPLDAGAFPEDLDRILVVLHNAKLEGIERLTAVQVSDRLNTGWGLGLHWRTVNSILLENHHLVDRKKRGGKWLFGTLRAGENRVTAPPSAILFVDPSKAVQAVLDLHGMLSQCRGVVRLCDPYFDIATLQHLDACSSASEVRVLTRNIKDRGSLRALHAAFGTQGRIVQVRVVGANVLHDRYLLDDTVMRILGTSLNGFGKKQCFVIAAGDDLRNAMLAVFEGHWNGATVWP
ncbi:MAG: hypothetical protein PHR35_13155 [Kiritimatiellae bacterium]|nr:hypothetical protein [Kiritimatiellia bacterium]